MRYRLPLRFVLLFLHVLVYLVFFLPVLFSFYLLRHRLRLLLNELGLEDVRVGESGVCVGESGVCVCVRVCV